MKEKKPVPKFLKIILIVLLVLLALVLAIAIFAPDPEEESTNTTLSTTAAVPARAEATGKSDLDADELLGGYQPHDMLNDTTGKWKLTTYASTDGNVERYALSYFNKYFEEYDEIHWLVNFTNKTTTCIRNLSGQLFVDVFEYVENEEHDAKAIGGGQPLASYLIYLDNGDIEPIS